MPIMENRTQRQVRIPLLFLLQWDNEGTTGSWPWTCSTPSAARRRHCTPIWAGHAGTPWFEVDDGNRFFARHLK
jgi:hypothetical protein